MIPQVFAFAKLMMMMMPGRKSMRKSSTASRASACGTKKCPFEMNTMGGMDFYFEFKRRIGSSM